ncbi:MAG: two-component system C4-dicarboxylate transport response regulator DctD [Candidatus Azotimanducaceae bacterium]|jgi:two-component system C4-dicarboxylate transport response regulator DctD
MDVDIDIVDDEESVRTLYIDMLEALNYQARPFANPGDYLEFMGSVDYSPPKLAIVSDVNMPTMSGYEFMHAASTLHPHLRFVVATGSPEVPVKDEFACFYLTKPFELKKLQEILQALEQCNEGGAHPDVIRCASIDDRCSFCVSAWRCPRHG